MAGLRLGSGSVRTPSPWRAGRRVVGAVGSPDWATCREAGGTLVEAAG